MHADAPRQAVRIISGSDGCTLALVLVPHTTGQSLSCCRITCGRNIPVARIRHQAQLAGDCPRCAIRPLSTVEWNSSGGSNCQCPRSGNSRAESASTIRHRRFKSCFCRHVGASRAKADAHGISLIDHCDNGHTFWNLARLPTRKVVVKQLDFINKDRAARLLDLLWERECRP